MRRHDQAIREAREQELRARRRLVFAADSGDADGVQRESVLLQGLIRDRKLLEELERRTGPGVQTLVLSSLMLAQSFRYCTKTRDEGMHFIAGVEYEGLRLGTHIIPFPYARQSVAGASGDHRATHRIVIEAFEANHRILALIHSHPGSGQRANHPSAVDHGTQRLWEQGTRLVGGIWSRDGYLRWYSLTVPFSIEVVGNHMEKIDDRLFRLVPKKG